MSEDENAASQLAAIEEVRVTPAKPIPFELFGKKGNRATLLVNASTDINTMRGRNSWFNYTLQEPIYVTSVTVFASGYEFKECQFSWTTLRNDRRHTTTSSFQDGMFSFNVNELVDTFSFKPDPRYFGTALITKIEARGFTLSQVDDVLDQLSNLNSAKRKVIATAERTLSEAEEAEERLVALADSISETETEIKALNSEQQAQNRGLETIREKIAVAQSQFSKLSAESTAFEARIEQQNSTIETRTSEREQINKELAEKTSKLKTLEDSIYLFPSEIEEFAKKGSTDKSFYWKLAAVPIFIVACLSFALIKNAADLSTVLDEEENARIFSIFLTRMPYVIVSAAIIAAMYKIATKLITQIMRIDAQTRALAKLSIVATDISAASAEGLNLTDEEVYHLRTGLKMDILRDHLKTYISSEYDYSESERVRTRKTLLKGSREKIENSNEGKEEISVDEE